MKLRTQAALVLTSVVAVAVAVPGILHLRSLESSLRASIRGTLSGAAGAAAESIARFLDDSLRDARAVARALPRGPLDGGDVAGMEATLRALSQIYPKFQNGLFVLDATGALVVDYPPHPGLRGRRFDFREYFQRTMAEGRGVVGRPYRSARTGEPVLTFTAPLTDPEGRPVGVLGCSVRLLSPQALGGLRSARVGRSGSVYVYDADGLMILHPDEKRVLKRDTLAARGPAPGGAGVLASARKVPGTDWIVVAQQPRDEALAPVRMVRNRVLGVLAAAVILAVVLGHALVGRVTRPLERLRRAAVGLGEAVERGNAAPRLGPGARGPAEVRDLASSFADLSQRLDRTLTALRGSEERFRELVELLPEIVFETDDRGRIVFLNRVGFELSGCTRESLAQGLWVLDLVAPDDRDRLGASIRRAMEGEWLRGTSFRFQRRDGTTFPVFVRSAPIVRDGRTVGLRGVLVDLSDRERWEERLRRAAKLESIGQMAGGIAHEFNNLLVPILGFSELLEARLPPGTVERERAEQIGAAARRAADLVRQILAFSRGADKGEGSADLAASVSEAARFLRALTPPTVEIRVGDAPAALVRCSPGALHQVLVNLGANGAQAMGSSGGTLALEAEVAQVGKRRARALGIRPGEYGILRVSDTGVGIPPELMDRIFDPFFTTKEVGEGTGLGLSVVHGIVQTAGGIVEVASEPGRGSVFSVYLPLDTSCTRGSAGEEVPAAPAGSGQRILVVDDEEPVRETLRELLERAGYRAEAVRSGPDALERVSEHPTGFDLVITDQAMPRMQGVSLARRLHEVRPGLPVILCTGLVPGDTLAVDREPAIRAVVRKPVCATELACTVYRVLSSGAGKGGSGPS